MFCRWSCLVLYLSWTFMCCGGSMFCMRLFWVTPVNKWLHLLQRWKNNWRLWLSSVWSLSLCSMLLLLRETHNRLCLAVIFPFTQMATHSPLKINIVRNSLALVYLPELRLSVCAPVETLLVFQLSAGSPVTVTVTFLLLSHWKQLRLIIMSRDGPCVPWNSEVV